MKKQICSYVLAAVLVLLPAPSAEAGIREWCGGMVARIRYAFRQKPLVSESVIVQPVSRPATYQGDNGDGTFSLKLNPTPQEIDVLSSMVTQIAPALVVFHTRYGEFPESAEDIRLDRSILKLLDGIYIGVGENAVGTQTICVAWKENGSVQIRLNIENGVVVLGASNFQQEFEMMTFDVSRRDLQVSELVATKKLPPTLLTASELEEMGR